MKVLQISSIRAEVFFNQPIPTEFLTKGFGSVLEYCINRPHVRARFDRDPLSEVVNVDGFTNLTSLSWVEDTGATFASLVSLQDAADIIDPQVIATEANVSIQAEGRARADD